jgi:hypothetical protein
MEPFVWNFVEAAVPGGSNALRTAHTTARVALRRFRPATPGSIKISTQARGPYLLSGNWWDEKSWACAEWDVQLETETICRSYQNDNGWQIEGIYD